MKLEDVKNRPLRERRTCRANLRLYPSQMKFIEDHNISVQAIFDRALDELGHVQPKPEEIADISRMYGSRKSRGHRRNGKGKFKTRNKRWRG